MLGKVFKYFIEEWVPNLAAEQISKRGIVDAISKMTGKKKEGTTDATKEPTPAESSKIQDVKLGGYFNLSDSTALFDLYGILEKEYPGKNYSKKISGFIVDNYKDEDDRKNIRITIARLALLSYTTEPEKKITKIPSKKKGSPPTIKEIIGKPEIINPAIRFLAAFAELDDNSKKNILSSSGVLVSDIEIAIAKADKKAKQFARTVRKARRGLRCPQTDKNFPERRYKGAIREALGFGSK